MVSEQSDRGYPLFFSELERDACVLWEHRGVRDVDVHSHEFLELSYILNGSVEHTLDGTTEILRAGDYLIVDYGSCHSYVGNEGGRFDNIDCLFLPALLDPALEGTKSLRAVLEHYLLHFDPMALVQNPAHMVFHDHSGRILELLRRMQEESEKREAGYTELLRCYLIEILLLTMRHLEDAPAAAEVVEEPAPAPVEPAAEEVKEEKPAKKARKTNKKAAKTEEAPKAEEEIPATEESPAAIVPEDEEDEAPASAFAEKDIDPIWAKRMNGIMAMFQPIEAGTILTRVYKGQCYQVQVCADGSCIDYANGKSYNSLSHAARCITGRKSVPGRKFFKVDGKRVLHNDK